MAQSKYKTHILILLCVFINLGFMNAVFAAAPKKDKPILKPIVIKKKTPNKIKIAPKNKPLVVSKTQKMKLTTSRKVISQTKSRVKNKIQTIFSSAPVIQAPHTPNIYMVTAQFEQKLLKTMRDKHIPGCAVAIVYKNQVVFMNGYGVRTLGKPEKIDPDTVFQLGSVSKPIAATLTALLENRGSLNINDPVSRHLPNFCLNGVKDREAVKIKHVLNHTTGLPRAGFNHLIETFASHARIIRTLQTTHVSAPVGKRFDYHNAMYSLISEITLASTRQSFPDALNNYLLNPLNMTHTSATYSGLLKISNRASPHLKTANGKFTVADGYSTGYYGVAPAGGINSSVRDMSTFLKAQMGGFPNVLNSNTLARLQQPLIPTPNHSLSAVNGARDKIQNSSYGLGWRIIDFNQHKLVYHGGWVKGFKNFIAFMPDHEVGIVILHNSETNGFANRLAMQFLDIFFSSR